MTKLLAEVMRRIADLPDHRQDDAARVLLTLIENDARPYFLSELQLQEIEAAQAEADAGVFASDKHVHEVLARSWA
jgi:hypothetical protein